MRRRDLLTAGSVSIATGLLPRFAFAATPCPLPSLAVDSDASVATSCARGPAYAASLAPYEVKQLSGALAPTNGNATLESVTPTAWLNGDPGTNKGNVVDYWGGGAGDPANNVLYVWGGSGHTNGANNGIYPVDFSGTSRPTGMSLAAGSQSAIGIIPPSNGATNDSYSDGKPGGRHMYGGQVFVNGKAYSFGGSVYSSGNRPMTTWKFHVATGVYTKLADIPSAVSGWGCAAVLDPVTKKIFVTSSPLGGYAFFNSLTDAWGAGKTSPLSGWTGWDDLTLSYDSLRSRILVFGNGYNQVWTINWATETITAASTHPTTPAIMSASGVTALYDAVRDVHWVFGGKGAGAPGYTTLYEVKGATLAVTAHPLTGDAISVSSDNNGSFGRAVLLDGAIGFVSSFTAPASIIKLP